MTMLDDRHDSPAELDPFTTERLLLGALAPEDAPAGYAGVARIVAALRAPGRPEEVVGVDAAVLAALVVLTEAANDRRSLRRRAERTRRAVKAKVGALVFAGTLVGTSGLAAAGALPAPLQHVASRALARVGIHVPDPDPGAVSDVATTTGLTGRDKGKAISEAARDNNGHGDGRGSGGDHGRSGEPHGKSDQPHGKSNEPHGKSNEPHGKADEPHGTADEPQGDPGSANGSNGGGNGESDEQQGNSGGSSADHDSGNPHGVTGSGPSGSGTSNGNGHDGGGNDAPADDGDGNASSDGGGNASSDGDGNGGGNDNGGGNGGGEPSDAATAAPTGPTGATLSV